MVLNNFPDVYEAVAIITFKEPRWQMEMVQFKVCAVRKVKKGNEVFAVTVILSKCPIFSV